MHHRDRRRDLHHSYLRIAVEDTAPDTPRMQDPTPTDEHGRGLRVVDTVTRAWGVEPTPNGKEVWAVIGIDRHLTRGIECTVSSIL